MLSVFLRSEPAEPLATVSDRVNVNGANEMVEVEAEEGGRFLDQRKVKEMPMNGRDAMALMALAPGVAAPRGAAQTVEVKADTAAVNTSSAMLAKQESGSSAPRV